MAEYRRRDRRRRIAKTTTTTGCTLDVRARVLARVTSRTHGVATTAKAIVFHYLVNDHIGSGLHPGFPLLVPLCSDLRVHGIRVYRSSAAGSLVVFIASRRLVARAAKIQKPKRDTRLVCSSYRHHISLPRCSPSTALPTTDGTSVFNCCDSAYRDRGNMSGCGGVGKDRASCNKSKALTYLLWLVGGVCGLHHFYLGRDLQGVLWWCTFGGYFGFGWLRDVFYIGEYVADANKDEKYMRKVDYMVRVHEKVSRRYCPRERIEEDSVYSFKIYRCSRVKKFPREDHSPLFALPLLKFINFESPNLALRVHYLLNIRGIKFKRGNVRRNSTPNPSLGYTWRPCESQKL